MSNAGVLLHGNGLCRLDVVQERESREERDAMKTGAPKRKLVPFRAWLQDDITVKSKGAEIQTSYVLCMKHFKHAEKLRRLFAEITQLFYICNSSTETNENRVLIF